MNGSRIDHGAVRSGPGCYEERYRLASAVLSLAPTVLALGLGFLWHTHLTWAVLIVLLAIPAVIAVALRQVAFRADHAGITLGVVRLLPRRPAVFVAWADVEKIILYDTCTGGPGDRVPCIAVQRREGAPALPWGNTQAPGCPVPGVAAGATRPITSWRLDRERLAAVTAAVVPGIPVVHIGPVPGVEGRATQRHQRPATRGLTDGKLPVPRRPPRYVRALGRGLTLPISTIGRIARGYPQLVDHAASSAIAGRGFSQARREPPRRWLARWEDGNRGRC